MNTYQEEEDTKEVSVFIVLVLNTNILTDSFPSLLCYGQPLPSRTVR